MKHLSEDCGTYLTSYIAIMDVDSGFSPFDWRQISMVRINNASTRRFGNKFIVILIEDFMRFVENFVIIWIEYYFSKRTCKVDVNDATYRTETNR